MFGIAIIGDGDEVRYWTGAETWNVDIDQAATFTSEANAEAAVDLLKRAIPNLSETVQVVELEESEDDA